MDDSYPPKPPRTQPTRTRESASRERLVVLIVAVVFAASIGALLMESIVWYRSQIALLLGASKGDWQAGALLLALFSNYAKKQVALLIAAVMAMLGLGLSLHAMKRASQAEVAGSAGLKLSFASFSPGICAFLTAGVIVLTVVWKDDKFEAGAPSGGAEAEFSAIPKDGSFSAPK